jgi:pilus assembly protein TadC
MPQLFYMTHKFNMDQDEVVIPHTLPRAIRVAIVTGMSRVQPAFAERLRNDVIPAFVAFKNGFIPPSVFNYIYRRLRRNRSDSDLKCWYKVCWVVVTANLETYNAFQ